MHLASLSLIAIVGTTTLAMAYDPFPFERSDGKWGYVDDDHCWVIGPKYDEAYIFSGKAAVVIDNGQRRLIDKWGNPAKDWLWGGRMSNSLTFSEGLAVVSVGNRQGFVNREGKRVIDAQYVTASDFSEGLSAVWFDDAWMFGGPWGYIDQSGVAVIKPRFAAARRFSDGLAAVAIEGRWGYINQSGMMVIPPIFDASSDFSEGLAAIQINKMWGYVDKNGDIAIEPQFADAKDFSEERAAVVLGERLGFIDKSGDLKIPAQFDVVFPQNGDVAGFGSGRARVALNGQPFILDRSGHILLDPTCDHTR